MVGSPLRLGLLRPVITDGLAPSLMDGAQTINRKAWDIINRHLNSHRVLLKSLRQKLPRNPAKYGQTLEDLLMVGFQDSDQKNGDALGVLSTYFEELECVQEYESLRAVCCGAFGLLLLVVYA